MWVITRDVLFEENALILAKSEAGTKSKDFKPADKVFFEFRLLDGDGVVYYHGLSDSCDDDKAFDPLDYYGPHSGCTEIQYKVNGQWETL
jgi:hypothetical protein